MLGRYVVSYLRDKGEEVVALSRKEINIYEAWKKQRLSYVVTYELNVNPDWVINCAGITNKRPGISDEEMVVVNSLFPIVLEKICLTLVTSRPKVIHASTDCVFSGLVGDYTEGSDPSANTMYGLTKFLGDRTMSCIIRTSIIGEGPEGNGSLVEWAKSQKDKSVQGYARHYWNGITCLEWAKIAYEIITGKIKPWSGVRHFSSNVEINKRDLLEMIDEIYELNLTISSRYTETRDMTLACQRGFTRQTDLWDQIKEMKEYDINSRIL